MSKLLYNIKKLTNNRCKIVSISCPFSLSDTTIEEERIPSEIDGCTVVSIARFAGRLLRRLIFNKLIIPNTVETIYDNAFSYVEIKELIFEENSQIKKICGAAFSNTNIERLDINSKRPLEIGCLCFDNTHLNELDLTKCTKIKCFEPSCFTSADIRKVKLPPGIKKLGRNMFKDNHIDDLSFLLELKDCSYIPEGCFDYCNVSKIPDEIFKKYTIGHYAFSHNDFEELNIPEYAKLEQGVFSNNIKLRSVIINTPVILNRTFYGCQELQRVVIKNTTEIHAGAFRQCAIKDLIFEDNNLCFIDNYAFAGNHLTKLLLKNSNVTTIGYKAFADNDLVSVELPYYLTEIADTSFDDNSKLKDLDLKSSPFVEVKTFL